MNKAPVSPNPTSTVCASTNITPTVVIVSHFVPAAIGHGGHHRSHQIRCDCEEAVGKENVVVLSWPAWLESHRAQLGERGGVAGRARSGLDGAMSRLRRARYKTRHMVQPPHFSPLRFRHPAFAAHYQNIVASRPNGSRVCVLEDSGFSDLARLNARLKIPTIICPHNLESLDEAPLDFSKRTMTRAVFRDLRNEIEVYARCDERLFISKAEAGLVSGSGFASRFYPYRAVGELEENLLQIRRERLASPPDPNLFLMLGSANHASTRAGFRWFLEQAGARGLPPNARVVVAGAGTMELAPLVSGCDQFQFRGWMEQDELNRLMSETCALLIPQPFGFGALTRLAESETANVPVIVSQHATFAVDAPRLARVVTPDWNSWHNAMRDAQTSVRQKTAREDASGEDNKDATSAVSISSVLTETLKRHLRLA